MVFIRCWKLQLGPEQLLQLTSLAPARRASSRDNGGYRSNDCCKYDSNGIYQGRSFGGA
jgi:hypothetical protein